MTTKPIRIHILAKRGTFDPGSREHRACSNLDNLLMDYTPQWGGHRFYRNKMLGVNHDALAASGPQ